VIVVMYQSPQKGQIAAATAYESLIPKTLNELLKGDGSPLPIKIKANTKVVYLVGNTLYINELNFNKLAKLLPEYDRKDLFTVFPITSQLAKIVGIAHATWGQTYTCYTDTPLCQKLEQCARKLPPLRR